MCPLPSFSGLHDMLAQVLKDLPRGKGLPGLKGRAQTFASPALHAGEEAQPLFFRGVRGRFDAQTDGTRGGVGCAYCLYLYEGSRASRLQGSGGTVKGQEEHVPKACGKGDPDKKPECQDAVEPPYPLEQPLALRFGE